MKLLMQFPLASRYFISTGFNDSTQNTVSFHILPSSYYSTPYAVVWVTESIVKPPTHK
jgi:hypothetical protein